MQYYVPSLKMELAESGSGKKYNILLTHYHLQCWIANGSAAGNLRTNLRVMQRLSTNWQLITGAKPCHPLHGISRICSHADAAIQ